MKTMKQVLAEFQRMQKQLIGADIVQLDVYGDCDSKFWAIKVTRTTFTSDSEIKTRDYVEWTHFRNHSEADERYDERLLAEFKKKFNLK